MLPNQEKLNVALAWLNEATDATEDFMNRIGSNEYKGINGDPVKPDDSVPYFLQKQAS